MKARILGLALAAAVVMPAAQAGVLKFDFTAVGAGGTVPWYHETRDSIFHESGPRLNVVNGTYDRIENSGNGWGYIVHYATTTYDVSGYYTDYYVFNGDVAGPENAANYAYLSGSVTFDPAAARNMGPNPATMDLSALFSGTATPVYDADFPTIPMLPSEPQLAIGYSHDRADLVPQSTGTSFDGTYFSKHAYADGIPLVAGENSLEFLFYVGPKMDPGMTIMRLSGPAYDYDMYHRTDTTFLGFENVQMPVPEPTTWAMLLAGVGILGIARRRKNAA